jgi:hypothetical protein
VASGSSHSSGFYAKQCRDRAVVDCVWSRSAICAVTQVRLQNGAAGVAPASRSGCTSAAAAAPALGCWEGRMEISAGDRTLRLASAAGRCRGTAALRATGALIRSPGRLALWASAASGDRAHCSQPVISPRRRGRSSGHPGPSPRRGCSCSGVSRSCMRALTAADERPCARIAAACGGIAHVSGASRLGDAARVAIVRRSIGCPRASCALPLARHARPNRHGASATALTCAALPAIRSASGQPRSRGGCRVAAALLVALPGLAGTRGCCASGSAAG